MGPPVNRKDSWSWSPVAFPEQGFASNPDGVIYTLGWAARE